MATAPQDARKMHLHRPGAGVTALPHGRGTGVGKGRASRKPSKAAPAPWPWDAQRPGCRACSLPRPGVSSGPPRPPAGTTAPATSLWVQPFPEAPRAEAEPAGRQVLVLPPVPSKLAFARPPPLRPAASRPAPCALTGPPGPDFFPPQPQPSLCAASSPLGLLGSTWPPRRQVRGPAQQRHRLSVPPAAVRADGGTAVPAEGRGGRGAGAGLRWGTGQPAPVQAAGVEGQRGRHSGAGNGGPRGVAPATRCPSGRVSPQLSAAFLLGFGLPLILNVD